MAKAETARPDPAAQTSSNLLERLTLEAPADLAVVAERVNEQLKQARTLIGQGIGQLLEAVLPRIADDTMTAQNVSALMADLTRLAGGSGLAGYVTTEVVEAQKQINEVLTVKYWSPIINPKVAVKWNWQNFHNSEGSPEHWNFRGKFDPQNADQVRHAAYGVGQMIETLFGIATERLTHPQLTQNDVISLLTTAERAVADQYGVRYTTGAGAPSSGRLKSLLGAEPAHLSKLFHASPYGDDVNTRILKLVVGYVPERCVSYLEEFRYPWNSYNSEEWVPCEPACVSAFLTNLREIALKQATSPEIIQLIRAKVKRFNDGLGLVTQEVVTISGSQKVEDGDGNGYSVPDEREDESRRIINMSSCKVELGRDW